MPWPKKVINTDILPALNMQKTDLQTQPRPDDWFILKVTMTGKNSDEVMVPLRIGMVYQHGGGHKTSNFGRYMKQPTVWTLHDVLDVT